MITVSLSLSNNSIIYVVSGSVSTDIFLTITGHIFLLLCTPGNFFLEDMSNLLT